MKKIIVKILKIKCLIISTMYNINNNFFNNFYINIFSFKILITII